AEIKIHESSSNSKKLASVSPLGRSGSVRAANIRNGLLHFSERFEKDGMEFEEPSPQMFSFNNPYGACPTCEGFGRVAGIDEDLVIPDPEATIRNGAIAAFHGEKYSRNLRDLIKVAARRNLPIDTPYSELSKEVRKL